jgi:hypothetical protein
LLLEAEVNTEGDAMRRSFAEVVAAPPYGHKAVCPSLPNGHAKVTSGQELKRLLRRIASECPRPLLAEVVRADGDLLSIGLGLPLSFLTYIPEGGDPPYFSVVGDPSQNEEVCFDCNGEPSFYSTRNTVPFKLALEVVCQFAGSSGLPLPDLVEWEEV